MASARAKSRAFFAVVRSVDEPVDFGVGNAPCWNGGVQDVEEGIEIGEKGERAAAVELEEIALIHSGIGFAHELEGRRRGLRPY